MKMRLQKYLSQEGICSRRKGEVYIQRGLVRVNGVVVTELGTQVDPKVDKIDVSQDVIDAEIDAITIALYKPRGIITNCPQGKEKEIRDILPSQYKGLSSIGRLDKESEGLILLTSSGVLAKRCLDPKHPHDRVYLVWLSQDLTDEQIYKLEAGITLFGIKTKPLVIKRMKERLIQMTMQEGKNRQIRRMIQKVGVKVLRLKRTQFGPIGIGDLKIGEYRQLDRAEIDRF